MVIDDLPLDARALERSAPAASDAVAFTGGLGIAVGVLLLSIEYYTNEGNLAARGSTDLSVTREYLRLRVEPSGYSLKWSTSPLTGEIK